MVESKTQLLNICHHGHWLIPGLNLYFFSNLQIKDINHAKDKMMLNLADNFYKRIIFITKDN